MFQFAKSAVSAVAALGAFLAAYLFVVTPDLAWWSGQAGRSILAYAVIYAALSAAIEIILKVERASWRYVSTPDILVLARSTAITAALFLLTAFVLNRATEVPRSVLLLTWLLHFTGILGLRLGRRMAYDGSLIRYVFRKRIQHAKRRRLLLVGGTHAAEGFLRELSREPSPEYEPIALVAQTSDQKGQFVRGVHVAGVLGDLEAILADLRAAGRAPEAMLFLPPQDLVSEVAPTLLGRLKAEGVVLLRLPSMREMSDQTAAGLLRELSVEELLARAPVSLPLDRIRALIKDRRVLVTGAGGSIGSEICRQVSALGCAHLTMLDHSEFALFTIEQEIGAEYPALSRREIICDIRDGERLSARILSEAPDIIFHSAALKHVPLVERHPCEGVLTNILGTWNVVEAAERAGVAQMVHISTDKAVDPNNIMGGTKRLAEAVVRASNKRSITRFHIVRFGNVLGSAGSVVPTFRAQIERGGPVTVTHPEVERYFMTIPEAVQLVLHATAEGASQSENIPKVFVLDMGDPVRIVDLARNMIDLLGRPDVQIEVTGLRPGEKLSELLVDENERVLVRRDAVMEVVDAAVEPPSFGEADVQELAIIARTGDDQQMRKAVYRNVARLRAATPKARGA